MGFEVGFEEEHEKGRGEEMWVVWQRGLLLEYMVGL
jgi:hypothetical protein